MRVLIVTQYFWPEQFRINDLALGLRDRGHEVTVYTGKPNYPEGRFFPGYGFLRRPTDDYQGIPVIRVPLVPRSNGSGFRLALNYLSFALFASLLAPVRCRGRFDVIFVYEPSPVTVGLPALVLKALKRAPLLFWVQDLWPESLSATGAVQTPWILNLVGHLVRRIYRGCDRILVQSRSFIPAVARFVNDPRRIFFFPNSAEELYRPVAVEADAVEHRDLPAGFRVMFAGNIGAAQDFETILGAAERLKSNSDIQWVIIGDGRRLAWVSTEIARRGLQDTMRLLGRRPVETMPRFFALADAMLVTLKRNPIFALTIPAKVQSYLACARPVIAALDGEGAQVVREAKAGLTAEAENPQALADAVLALYRTPQDERSAMGRRGRDYFEAHFERGYLLGQLEDWMQESIKEHHANSHTRR
jgi:colanic acid biosynthesis glycosyl transferase WcaI